MPLQYETGTIAEHLACRGGAVVFDVSHLGTVRVEGPDALARLQSAFTNDLSKIAPGRAQYTHLLDPDDASVLDEAGFRVLKHEDTGTVIAQVGFCGMSNEANRARAGFLLAVDRGWPILTDKGWRRPVR